MSASDARPVPRKNVAFRVYLPILDADGDPVSGAASLDSEISKDGGNFADCTNEATEIQSTGMYFLDLTSTEMDADAVVIIVKTGTAGAKTTPIIMYPEEAGDFRADVTHWGGTVVASANVLIDGAITATKFAADAITAAKLHADVTTELQSGLATASALTALAGKFTGITLLAEWLGLIAGKQTGNSTARTELRATGGGSGTFDETTDSQEALRDRGDAAWTTATGFSTHSAADVWAVGTRELTAFSASFKTGYALSAAGVQAIWDALTSALTTVGSIGKLLVDNINATISSRATQTSVDDLPTNAELATSQAAADDATLAAIAALNNISAAQVNAEVDAAIETYHLDHLLAVTYDPASKPGAADALLNEIVESDGGVARFTANALEQAPTGGSAPTAAEIADEVRVELATELGRIDATVSSRASQASVDDLPTNAELATSQAAADDATLAAIAALNNPSAGAIADAVWEEDLTDHSGTAGSTAEALGAAGSAGDPWATALPGAYSSGQAGKILGDNLNATVSSRATQTSVDDVPTNAELATSQAAADDATLAAIAALNNLSAAQVRTELATELARIDVATSTRASQVSVDDLPTNAELATSQAAADDATLAAIAALSIPTAAANAAAVLAAAALDPIDGNIKEVNDVALQGVGVTGDSWRPA